MFLIKCSVRVYFVYYFIGWFAYLSVQIWFKGVSDGNWRNENQHTPVWEPLDKSNSVLEACAFSQYFLTLTQLVFFDDYFFSYLSNKKIKKQYSFWLLHPPLVTSKCYVYFITHMSIDVIQCSGRYSTSCPASPALPFLGKVTILQCSSIPADTVHTEMPRRSSGKHRSAKVTAHSCELCGSIRRVSIDRMWVRMTLHTENADQEEDLRWKIRSPEGFLCCSPVSNEGHNEILML